MDEKLSWFDGLKAIGGGIGTFCANNKAHICTGVAITGTIVTGVASARSGARSARKIDRKEAELGRKLTRREKVKLCGKDYIVPGIAGVFSIAGAVGSDVINTRDLGRTTAMLIASEKAYEKLSQKTKEVLGEKKARQVQDEIAKEKIADSDPNGTLLTKSAFENAPKSGNGMLYPFIDAYSGLPFWSNIDFISLTVKDLNILMREMNPRGDEYDYYDKVVGVPYSEWLKSLGFDRKIWNTDERKHHGWNRGFAKDGEDDDPISFYTRPIEFEPGFAVTAVYWEKDPTDMRLGRLMKSQGL